MTELVCELIVSLDGFARGRRSPAYYGYFGPDFADWIKTNTAMPHQMLIGRRTYEAMEGGTPRRSAGRRLAKDDDNARLAVLAHPGGDRLAGVDHRPR